MFRIAAPAKALSLNSIALPVAVLLIVALPAVEVSEKVVALAAPLLVIVAFWAVAVSLNNVWVFVPLFKMMPVPALDVPKKRTVELGNGPFPLLLIVAAPTVALSKKLTTPATLVLLIVEVPAVDVSKNSIELEPETLVSTAFAAVAALVKSRKLLPVLLIVLIAAEPFTIPVPTSVMPAELVIVYAPAAAVNVMLSIVIAAVTVGFKTVDAPKIAASPATLGALAGVFQFVLVFQLFVAGTSFHVAAELELGINTRPQNAAMDDARNLTGRAAGGRIPMFVARVVARGERFIGR